MNKESIRKAVDNWRYPLLILVFGIGLMLLPTGGREREAASEEQEPLAAMLSETQGVGKTYVLISDKGVVVACTGASNPSVRLDIIHAVGSYTGFGSDKITILKLKD